MEKVNIVWGQTYITTYGAVLTVNRVTYGWNGKVEYASSHVHKPHPAAVGLLDLYVFEQMIRDRTIFLDTPANRILYCSF